MSQIAVADFLGVTNKTVMTWRDCPRNADKSYDLKAVVRWRIERLEARTKKVIEPKHGDLRERRLALDCRLKELEIAGQERKVYDRDFVHGVAAQQATALREFWQSGWKREAPGIVRELGLPASAVPGLTRCLDGLVVEMMGRWCAAGREISGGGGGGEDGEDTADGADRD